MSQEDLLDRLSQMSKLLEYMLYNQDHDNVKQLFTEYCNIQSEDGETVIDGPLLTMRAAGSTTIRLKQGYDPASGNFVFNLYNTTGGQTVGIDSTGNATFTGTITGSIITGGTIRTASTGERIEITDNNFFMYNSSNQLEGLVFGSTFGTWGDVFFYNDGVLQAKFFQGSGFVDFQPASTNQTVGIGIAGANTYINGYLKHTGNKLGFYGKNPIARLSIVQTASTVADTIRDKLNALIDGLHQYGLFSS
jgi:hypothetical protein